MHNCITDKIFVLNCFHCASAITVKNISRESHKLITLILCCFSAIHKNLLAAQYLRSVFPVMYKPKPGIDIIAKILDALYKHNPDALFVMSLMHQYEERGSLSKKQLQGLLSKAQKAETIPGSWLGTLEAIILKMPTRYKPVEPVVITPVYRKDETAGVLIKAILARYPQHKRVLFLQAKYDNNEPLSAEEITELKKFAKVLRVEP